MSVEAIYRGILCQVTECYGATSAQSDEPTEEQLDYLRKTYPSMDDEWRRRVWRFDGAELDHELWVSFMHPDLIVEPTNAQVEEQERRFGRPLTPKY